MESYWRPARRGGGDSSSTLAKENATAYPSLWPDQMPFWHVAISNITQKKIKAHEQCLKLVSGAGLRNELLHGADRRACECMLI